MCIKELIKRHEGLRLRPYKCTAGKLTIGYGRNLEDVGITEEEAMCLLEGDLRTATGECHRLFPNFSSLSDMRRAVLINMMFNLGVNRLSKFKKMREALANNNFKEASIEMLDSKWAKQVGDRADELSYMMAHDKLRD